MSGKKVQTFDIDMLDAKQTAGELIRITVGDWQELDRRMKVGEKLTDEELKKYTRGKEIIQIASEAIRRNLFPAVQQWQTIVKQFQAVVLPKIPPAIEQIGKWQKLFMERVAPAIGQMVVAFQNMPPRFQEALITLAKNGWYLDLSMPFSDIWEFEALLNKGETEAVDDLLIKHFEERLDEIEESLVSALPKRERILRAAFRAHRHEEFELSVPVFLAQSDGVCLELTGYHFFIKDKKTQKPGPTAYVESLVGKEVQSAILAPLTETLPIAANSQERNKILRNLGVQNWQELNRHIVLHGESIDYGLRINSLKAISLINYLVGAIRYFEKDGK